MVLCYGGYLTRRMAWGAELLNPLVTLRERDIGMAIGRNRIIRGDVYPIPINRIPLFRIRLVSNPYSCNRTRFVVSNISREAMLC